MRKLRIGCSFSSQLIGGEQIKEPPAEKIYEAVFIGSSYDAEAVHVTPGIRIFRPEKWRLIERR